MADEPEAPSGYEDAPEAGEAPKAAAEGGGFGMEEPTGLVQILKNAIDGNPDGDILKIKVDANVLNLEGQFLPQFQQLVKVERSFILRVCQLDKKQQSRIVKASDRCAKVTARKFAFAQNQGMRGGGKFVDVAVWMNGAATGTDPRDHLGRELLLSVKELLSPEQKKQYAEENRKRQDHLKRVTVLNLVVLLDKRLVLTAEQREQLIDSLTKNWKPSWAGALQHLSGSDSHMPRIEDKHVVKFLNAKQKTLWKGIQKVSFSSNANFGFNQQGAVIEDDFAMEEPDS
jgi:hypothetical protein